MSHSSEHSCSSCCSSDATEPLLAAGLADGTPLHATWQYRVAELDCAEEVGLIRSSLDQRSGIIAIRFDLLDRRVDVDVQAQGPSGEQILVWIKQTGLTVSLLNDESVEQQHTTERTSQQRATWELVFGGVANLIAILWAITIVGASPHSHSVEARWLEPYSLSNLPAVLGHALAIVICGYRLVPRAWAAVRLRRADMNVLMVVAVIGAMVIGEWSEAGLVTWLFALSLRLESWSLGRARDAISKLLDLTPPVARVRRDGEDLASVPVEQVSVGTLIEVLPGDRVPLDGEVTRGESELDLSSLTGESLPAEVRSRDEVLAGAINLSGSLTLRVKRPASDSQLARVYRAMKEAQQKRGSTERWVDQFAQWYTPSMALIALAVAIVPSLFLQKPWLDSIHSALVLLVTACPCALVISTPVTIVAALTAAARRGLVLRGGDALERLSQVNAVAFDKTGTLTQGVPQVSEVLALGGVDRETLLQLAGRLEQHSSHPISRAIVAAWQSESKERVSSDSPSGKTHECGSSACQHLAHESAAKVHSLQVLSANDRQGQTSEAQRVTLVAGHGVEAQSDESLASSSDSLAGVWVGNERMVSRHGARLDASHQANSASAASMKVWIGRGSKLLGQITLSDPVRDEAAASVAELRRLGIGSIAILSGDSSPVVDSLAKQLQISDAHGGLLPTDKIQRIEAYRERSERVLMVGDGVNDAAALAGAHVGLALGDHGTDIAKSAADGVLLRDSLELVPWSIRHARRSKQILIQNLTVALIVKIVFFALAISGYSSLWLAILADTGTSLAVIANALRAMRQTR